MVLRKFPFKINAFTVLKGKDVIMDKHLRYHFVFYCNAVKDMSSTRVKRKENSMVFF
jgi:hypothetical protein